ncbi:hypothetical protein T03_3839 [Trichinella britovi]|uniref:Uncharacterized protein n=1 Tax=Trichinella britovi TaxID=45882 RepID=A0A0V0YVS4_TRIBR|nr:hypothetical protein T03_3839 [Trichinella britovi]
MNAHHLTKANKSIGICKEAKMTPEAVSIET